MKKKTAICLSALVLTVSACSSGGEGAGVPLDELVPQGELRVGIGVGSATSAFWATPDPDTGEPRGVTVDLGRALAMRTGVPLELVVYPNSGAITDAGPKGEWDVTFMPVDATRAQVVDFGPAYYLSDSAILVAAGSDIQTLAEVNRPGVRVGAVQGTTTGRSATALFVETTMVYYDEVDEIVAAVRAGAVDGVALGRESLLSLQGALPGSRVLEEGYNETGVAVAVPKGHAESLAYVTAFIEEAKASGVVSSALRNAGLQNTEPAPPQRAP